MPSLNALAFIVVVELTGMGLEYTVDEVVGVVSSVVYLIVASLVVQLMVTLWGKEYVPALGLNVGSAILGLMVYSAEAVSLSVMPSLKALALIVVVELTSIGSEYWADEVVGVEPSVVYLIVVVEVEQLSTIC